MIGGFWPIAPSGRFSLQYLRQSALRKSYRERGYIDVGNEWLKNESKPPKPKTAIILLASPG
jgi:hypothetical protein